MLDSNLKPWLIEVNLSPACSERTQFLKNMLADMTEHLFRILRVKEKIQTENFHAAVEEYKKNLAAKKKKLDSLKDKEKAREKNYGSINTGKSLKNSQNYQNLQNSIMKQSGLFNSSAHGNMGLSGNPSMLMCT
jgi:hypothetical protein